MIAKCPLPSEKRDLRPSEFGALIHPEPRGFHLFLKEWESASDSRVNPESIPMNLKGGPTRPYPVGLERGC